MGGLYGVPLPIMLFLGASLLIYVVQLPYIMQGARSTRQLLSIDTAHARASRSLRSSNADAVTAHNVTNSSQETPTMALVSTGHPGNVTRNVTGGWQVLQVTKNPGAHPPKIVPLYANKKAYIRQRVYSAKDLLTMPTVVTPGGPPGFSLDGKFYPFIITAKDVCKTDGVSLINFVTVIISGSGNFLDRRTVRETWAQARPGVRFVFLLGRPKNEKTQEQILEENKNYGDLVQGDFMDTYRNLTLKAVMALKWASTYCSSATYMFKTDDDTFAHLPNIVRYLHKIGQRSKFITCRANDDHRPEHDEDSKWYVPESQFNESFYPVYCSGAGYIVSMDVVSRLYSAATVTPSIPIEDAYVTGILTRKIGVGPRMNLAFGYEKELDGINMPNLMQAFQWIFTYTGHSTDGVVKFQHTMMNIVNFHKYGGHGVVRKVPTKRS